MRLVAVVSTAFLQLAQYTLRDVLIAKPKQDLRLHAQLTKVLRDAASATFTTPEDAAYIQASCASFSTACPKDIYPTEGPDDLFGTRPTLCRRVSATDADYKLHLFHVTVCKHPLRLRIHVEHINGFVDNIANRDTVPGPDFLTAQLAGPELKLIQLVNNGSNAYEAEVTCLTPGTYRFDVTVVHTPYEEEDTVVPYSDWPRWHVRNLLLLDNEVWNASFNSLCAAQIKLTSDLESPRGRWVYQPSTERHGPVSQGTQVADTYRCALFTKYVWLPLNAPSIANDTAEEELKAYHSCMRSGKVLAERNITRFLFLGDSQMRTTFNALLDLIWPGDTSNRATKDFKSTDQPQCFGKQDDGYELCFEWAPYLENADMVPAYLKQYDRVLMNAGQHMLYKANDTFEGYQQRVGEALRSLHSTIGHLPFSRSCRFAWLQTYPFPATNKGHFVASRDRRNIPLISKANKDTAILLLSLDMHEVRVDDMLIPFYDCTYDGAHYISSLLKEVARRRILPWLCSACESG